MLITRRLVLCFIGYVSLLFMATAAYAANSTNARLLFNHNVPAVTDTSKTSRQVFAECAYIHTDKDVYLDGDTLWYKAYVVNARNFTPVPDSLGTLYVSLIATGGRVVTSQIIRLKYGCGYGDITLYTGIGAGSYTLRAYTNWMLNFGDNFIFEKQIQVIDPDNTAPASTPKQTAIKSKTKNKQEPDKTPIVALPVPTLNLYPEGGDLVEGIIATVAIKTHNAQGWGCMARGSVFSSSGDTVTRFTCDSLGMGMFNLLPVKGETYYATTQINGVPITTALPTALVKGFAMNVKQQAGALALTVSKSLSSTDTAYNSFTLVLKQRGQVLVNQKIQSQDTQTPVKLKEDNFAGGIAELTILDAQGRPNCERLVYLHGSGAATVGIALNKPVYKANEQASITLNVGRAARLSVAVVDAGIVPLQNGDIRTALLLTGELRGDVEKPQRYFDTLNMNRHEQLNLLLLTQGWRSYVWRRIGDDKLNIKYAYEKGINLSGSVINEITRKFLPGMNVTLYDSQLAGTKMFSTVTNQDGRFFFDINFEGTHTVKLSAINNKGKKNGIFAIDTLLAVPAKVQKTSPFKAAADTGFYNSPVFKKRATALAMAGKPIQLKAVKVTGKSHIFLDNGDIFMSYLPPVTHVIKPGDYKWKTLTWYAMQNFKGAVSCPTADPGIGFMVDGKFTYPKLIVNNSSWNLDYDLYWNMPIDKIVKVVLQTYIPPNSASYRYLIYITTKENALTDNPGVLNYDASGYYQAKVFSESQNSINPSQYQNMRSTIHWQPMVETDKSGKATINFYNASLPANVRVIVQGVTQSGKPVSGVAYYEVE